MIINRIFNSISIRRSWTPSPGDGNKPMKRLFTPEIKRMLKEWLVRRRENPYPSREEKKALAHQTGLTYIQICNWFANWRRKLKNAGKEPQKNTWGNLIKNYNNNARGNVEQFSICSRDSIWEEAEMHSEQFDESMIIAEHNDNYQMPIYANGKYVDTIEINVNEQTIHLPENRHLDIEFLKNSEQCFQV